mgnify:CR=1 FL=1
MNASRSRAYKKYWQELIQLHGPRCYYCQKEIATTIDHVVPYSWDADNEKANLVLACGLCNSLAGNMMFDSVEQKRQYILGERKKRVNQRAICAQCLLPFTYRRHSPSLLLCAECYDEEYDTDYSKTKEWRKWIYQLKAAGIPAEAHRNMKKKMSKIRHRSMEAKLELLIDEYAYVVGTDEEFAAMLVYS